MKNKKRKKSYIAAFLDIMIALTLLIALTLGFKYSIQASTTEYVASVILDDIDQALANPIDRDQFNDQIGGGIYKIKVNGYTDWMPVVEGDDLDQLAQAIGHHTGTGHPGDNRQIFLSAHRESFYGPLEGLAIGTQVTIFTPYGKYEYIVARTEIVDPNQVDVIRYEQLDQDELVLMTCYPFDSWSEPEERFLVYAYPKQ